MKFKVFFLATLVAAGFTQFTFAGTTVSDDEQNIPGVAAQPDSYFFTGKPYDENLGGYVFAGRTYDPELCRWTTPDPAGFPDGPNNRIYAPIPTSQLDLGGMFTINSANTTPTSNGRTFTDTSGNTLTETGSTASYKEISSSDYLNNAIQAAFPSLANKVTFSGDITGTVNISSYSLTSNNFPHYNGPLGTIAFSMSGNAQVNAWVQLMNFNSGYQLNSNIIDTLSGKIYYTPILNGLPTSLLQDTPFLPAVSGAYREFYDFPAYVQMNGYNLQSITVYSGALYWKIGLE